MAEKLEKWPSDEGRCPESGYRMAVEGMPFSWRWTSGTISTNLDVIWGMSVKSFHAMISANMSVRAMYYPYLFVHEMNAVGCKG